MPAEPVELLADPTLHAALRRFVRARVPQPDVDDVVQATLVDAISAAGSSLEGPDDFRRWVFGIAKNKAFDVHRRRARELPSEPDGFDAVESDGEALAAHDLMRWVERELPEQNDAERTFHWMLREGTGEKLEHIAAEEALPAARVRKRVSRLRRHFKTRWAAQFAAAVALMTAIAIGLWVARKGHSTSSPVIAPVISADPAEPALSADEKRAREIRREAFSECQAFAYTKCLESLDRAAKLDPAGDSDADVQAARAAATRGLELIPAPVLPSARPD